MRHDRYRAEISFARVGIIATPGSEGLFAGWSNRQPQDAGILLAAVSNRCKVGAMRLFMTHVPRGVYLPLFWATMAVACFCGTTASSATQNHVQDGQSLTLKGTAIHAGIAQEWTLTVDSDGRGVSTITGSYSAVTGYDGASLWRIENGAGPFNVDFAEREVWLMTLLTLVGRESGIATAIGDENESKNGVRYQLDDGLLVFEKNKTGQLHAINSPAAETITFSADDHPSLEGVPQSIQISNIGKISEYRIVSAEIGPSKGEAFYSRPMRRTEGFRFLSGISAELEVRQASSGHLFVRPLINGKDVGWFLFDSGAGFSGLNGALAEQAGFERAGSKTTGGVGGPGQSRARYIGGPVQLGPLVIDSLAFTDVGDMTKAQKVLGEPVVGVLGWDVLIRTIIEVDLRDGRLFLHDPANYRAAAAYRQPLYIHWDVPYVRAHFAGGHEGPFMFDTGAGSRGVIFTYFSGNRFSLADKITGTETIATGAGGKVSQISGQLDWFEVADHRTSPAPAAFFTADDYESDIFTVGFLGGAVVLPFRVTLDYGRGEAGFIPRASQ